MEPRVVRLVALSFSRRGARPFSLSTIRSTLNAQVSPPGVRRTKRAAVVTAALFGALGGAVAWAVPPMLGNVSHDRRHPKATISAPRADYAVVYIATRPDRATDGSFLSENVKDLDILTDQEIQTGAWLYETALDPGTWYLMARATAESSCYSFPPPDYRTVIDPACANGYSEVVTLTIPAPATRYSAKVEVLRNIGIGYLTLRATPLGEDRAYRACWRLRNRKRVCVRGTLDGYDWDASVTDLLRVNARGMGRFTTFTWEIGSSVVARKRARTR